MTFREESECHIARSSENRVLSVHFGMVSAMSLKYKLNSVGDKQLP